MKFNLLFYAKMTEGAAKSLQGVIEVLPKAAPLRSERFGSR